MLRLACVLLVLCPPALEAAPGAAERRAWTFVFVVAADTPAPTETRRGLDAVAREARELAQRLTAHSFIIVHAPSDSARPYLAAVRGRASEVHTFQRTEGPSVSAFLDALKSCPSQRRALFFVGHSDVPAGRDSSAPEGLSRLGMPFVRSGLAAWVEREPREPFDLVVLHCCYSARIETILALSSHVRWLVASETWIQPQALDYAALAQASEKDTGRGLAEKLIAAASTPSPCRDRGAHLVLVNADGPRLRKFLTEFDSFARVLRRAIRAGHLSPREFGDLHEPAGRGLADPGAAQATRSDLLSLLAYAGRAHWLPKDARVHARAALAALAPLVAKGRARGQSPQGEQCLVTVGFPSGLAAARWEEYLGARFAQACAWPQLVATANRLALKREPLFLGWGLERELISVRKR